MNELLCRIKRNILKQMKQLIMILRIKKQSKSKKHKGHFFEDVFHISNRKKYLSFSLGIRLSLKLLYFCGARFNPIVYS